MKHFILPLVFLFSVVGSAQSMIQDTLFLNRQQAEKMLLENNLSLLAEKLNIDIAQAQIIQAKVWPNPTLSVNEFNFWSNSTSEQLPKLWGNYGRNQEFGASIEQLVYTAGKRKKMIAIEKVGADKAVEYFNLFLRNLKTEFRLNLTALQCNQAKKQVFQNQLKAVSQLVVAYKKQKELGYSSQGEYIRLKASELEFKNELNSIEMENNELQSEIKKLLLLNPNVFLKLDNKGFVPDYSTVQNLNLQTILDQAVDVRPDVKVAQLEENYNAKKYEYEKALRTPDVTLEASYDRGGNILRNFVGFGFSIDLPFFDRNKGNITAAQVAVTQSELQKKESINKAQSEIVKAYTNFDIVKNRFEEIENGYDEELDRVLDKYLFNFKNKNISLQIYLDYLEAYLKNKIIVLDTKKEVNDRLEEFKNASGLEFKE